VIEVASGPSAGRSSGLCLATVVFGDYREYIPYYIHSISAAYPTYAVKVFVTDPGLPERVSAGLECLQRLGLSRFEVRVGCFPLFPDSHTPVVGRQALGMYQRWLLPPTEFAGFEYSYVGDIDFLILPEAESLLEGHLRHIRALGVPYSNVVRRDSRRLSGLHFFEVRPYFAAVAHLIRFYSERAERVRDLGLHNEEFLYHLIEQTIGFGTMATARWFRPKHGFHLGCVRRWNQVYVDRWLERSERRARLAAYLDSEGFQAIHRLVGNRDVDMLLRVLRGDRRAGATHPL
jgi:hypothetical protein